MRIFLFSVLAALTACSASFPEAITTAPVEVALTSKGRAEVATKIQKVSFRAYENVGGDQIHIEERVGVVCTIENSEFSARISTPAFVNIPVFGPTPEHIQASCTFNGETLTQGSLCLRQGESNYCTYADYSFVFGK